MTAFEAQGYLNAMIALQGISRRLVERAAALVGAGDAAAAAYYQDAIELTAAYAAEQPEAAYCSEFRTACLVSMQKAAAMLAAFQDGDITQINRARAAADQAMVEMQEAIQRIENRIGSLPTGALPRPPVA
jgi:hypothetical protein